MKSIKHYIIKLENPYNETFKTESGFELYGNVDFSVDRLGNRIAEIVSVPELNKSEIKEGYEVLIDFSNFYRQIFQKQKTGFNAVIDSEKNLYYLTPNMIICFRENEKSEWKGFGQNCLVKPILEEVKPKSNLILPETVTEKKFDGKVKMIYANSELNELGVKNGDIVYIDRRGGVKYWLDGVEYWWIMNRHIKALSR